MKITKPQRSTYQIEGEFLGFIPKPGGELKYIQVRVGERIIPIKLAKELRETLGRKLVKGDRLSVLLEQTVSGHGIKLKLKTNRVAILGTGDQSLVLESASVSSASKPEKNQKGKILLCGKSSCSKRRGKQLDHALTETLKQLGLQDRVSIKLTGCQKQCKKASSIILMPGKVKHAYVHTDDLASLLEAHYLVFPN